MESNKENNILDYKLYSAMNNLMKKLNQVQSESKCDLLPELRVCIELLLGGANPDNLHKNFKINLYQFLCNISTFSTVRLQQLGLLSKVRLVTKLVLMLLRFQNIDTCLDGDKHSYCDYTYEFLKYYGLDSIISKDVFLKFDASSSISKSALLSLPHSFDLKSFESDSLGKISKILAQLLLIHCNVDEKKSGYSNRSASKVPLYTEVDGSPSRDIFTVLTFASIQQSEVLQSIYTFSILMRWLLHLQENDELYEALDFQLNKFSQEGADNEGSPYAVGGSRFYDDASSDSDSFRSLTSSFSSLQSFTQNSVINTSDDKSTNLSKFTLNESPSIRRRKTFDTISITSDVLSSASNIRNIVCRYCLRVIHQSEKLARHKSDKSVITSSTIECIHILNILCRVDLAISQRVFMEIKRLHKHIEKDPFAYRRVFVALLQFFINHHEEMLIPIDKIFEKYFMILPEEKYNDQTAVFEFFELCTRNKIFFCSNKDIIKTFAPNMLKLFVWWPITFTDNMKDMLEIMITQNNVLEMFHAIVDLPVLVIAMFLRHKRILENEVKLKDFFHGDIKPYFAAMFKFFLRSKSSGVDTIDRLSELFNGLQHIQNHPRVKYVATLVPYLLLEYFDIVYGKEDKELLKLLYPVILERIFYIYPESMAQEVQMILCDQLINIAELVPEIFSLCITDIHIFMNQLQLVKFYHPDFFKKVFWSLGEFASSGQCSHDDVAKFFTTLEAYLSEMMDKVGKSVNNLNNNEVISSLIIALSKLATYSQDLIQTFSIRMNKLLFIPYEKMSDHMSLIEYLSIQRLTKQMIKAMQKPNVVESLICSDTRKKPWHNDEHNSMLLKVHVLLDRK